jgi:O-antigen ligase
MFFGRSSASGRFANILVLFDAWISRPLAPIVGLGYSAFEYYSGTAGEPYSHVIFADAIFELGLPGAVLMGIFIVTSTRSAIRLFRSSSDDLDRRSSAVMLIAWFAYEALLANKQGAFWVMPMMFPAGIALSQLALHEVRPSEEEASSEPQSSELISPVGQP